MPCLHARAARCLCENTSLSCMCPFSVNITPEWKPGARRAGAFAEGRAHANRGARPCERPAGCGTRPRDGRCRGSRGGVREGAPVCVCFGKRSRGLEGEGSKLVEREVTKSREIALPKNILKMSPLGLPEDFASRRCLSATWRGTRGSSCPCLPGGGFVATDWF